MTNLIKIWDLPTRLFHGALALLIAGAFITVNLGDDWMTLHGQMGLVTLALIVFRICWGVFGGHWSQFRNFALHPRQMISYLKVSSFSLPSYLGHNPLGSWSALLMIFSLALQALSGLCSDDQILFKGPLTLYLNESQIEWASFYHSEVGQPLLIALIGTHLFAVLFYKYKLQHDLIKPMLSGYKSSDSVVAASVDNLKSRLLALGCFACIVFLLFYFLPVQ